jgi:magnesium-transporting ATPase (P-type)
MTLSTLVISEWITKVGTIFGTALAYPIIMGERAVIAVDLELAWVLYYQLLIWFNLIFFPYVVVLTPFIIYSLFQTYYIALTYLTKKPQAESNRDATGIMLTTLINASLLVWIVATGTLMLVDHPAYERLADPNKIKHN